MAVNPYAAPQSRVEDHLTASIDGNFVPGGQGVPAGNGWGWISSAWEIFKQQKGVWVGIFVIFAVILIVLNLIPFIGALLQMFVLPVLYGGVMLGCEAVRRGESMTVGHLFAGFSRNTGRLVGVGALSLGFFIVILVVIMLIFGSDMARIFMGSEPTPEQMQTIGMRMLLAVLIMLLLSIPFYMALWFAPVLIVLNDHTIGAALKASFSACLKNILPFLVYGIVFFVFAILATIPLGLGWLLLGPVLLASIYTAYRDIFYET
ncbi:MAG TPA: BPSS1780 family membrane protein [Burkholderiales bacterium]|nr:BPSS1780 family membrane protein [Burkholderiales bacterium]